MGTCSPAGRALSANRLSLFRKRSGIAWVIEVRGMIVVVSIGLAMRRSADATHTDAHH